MKNIIFQISPEEHGNTEERVVVNYFDEKNQSETKIYKVSKMEPEMKNFYDAFKASIENAIKNDLK